MHQPSQQQQQRWASGSAGGGGGSSSGGGGGGGGWGRGGDVEGSQESASEADSRDFPSPLRARPARPGPPSTASERDETLRSWDASVSAASASDGEERRSGEEGEADADPDADGDADSTSAGSSDSSGSREDWLHSALSGMERYNPAHIAPLEALLERQASGEEPYCCDANLALLLLYQLHPRRFSAPHARLALLLALGRLPRPDLALAKCLLGPALNGPSGPLLGGVLALGELLERCDFAAFWERVRAQPEVVGGVRGLGGAVRAFVAHVVGAAFQRLSARRLNALLGGLPDDELRRWLRERGWELEPPDKEGDEATVFVGNQEQVVRNRRIVERVELDTVERLLARLAD